MNKEGIIRTAAATTIGLAGAANTDVSPSALHRAMTGITSGNVLNIDGGMPSENIFALYGVEAKTEDISVSFSGFPDKAENVELASGNFVNVAGGGSEMLLAEPGKLMVGWDFPKDQVDAANGAIEYINPTNQQVFENETASFNLPEGGMVFASGGSMTVEFDGKTIEMQGSEGHIFLLYVRGKYADETTPEDNNTTMHFTDYSAGHIQAMRYPGVPNGGFISEEQAEQQAGVAQEGGTNCGSTGCPEVTRVFADANTGAYVVQELNDNGEWVTTDSNFAEVK